MYSQKENMRSHQVPLYCQDTERTVDPTAECHLRVLGVQLSKPPL